MKIKTFRHFSLVVFLLGQSIFGNLTINIPTCSVEQKCDDIEKGNCTTLCQFGRMNAIGSTMTVKPMTNAFRQNIDFVTKTEFVQVILPNDTGQSFVTYTPTLGRNAQQDTTLLFYLVNLSDSKTIKTLSKKNQDEISKYKKMYPRTEFVLFSLKNIRGNVWKIIAQTYLGPLGIEPFFVFYVQADGNITIRMPNAIDDQGNIIHKKETIFIKLDQIS